MGGTSADRVTAAEADTLGESGGAETHTLSEEDIPSHRHPIYFGAGTDGNPSSDRVNAQVAEGGTFTPAGTPPSAGAGGERGVGFGFRDIDPDDSISSRRGFSTFVAPSSVPNTFTRNGASFPGHPIGLTGSGQAHNNMPPYLSLNYIIKT